MRRGRRLAGKRERKKKKEKKEKKEKKKKSMGVVVVVVVEEEEEPSLGVSGVRRAAVMTCRVPMATARSYPFRRPVLSASRAVEPSRAGPERARPSHVDCAHSNPFLTRASKWVTLASNLAVKPPACRLLPGEAM